MRLPGQSNKPDLMFPVVIVFILEIYSGVNIKIGVDLVVVTCNAESRKTRYLLHPLMSA